MSWSVVIGVVILQGMALAAIMSGAWLARRATGNSGWIDFTWTAGTGLVGVVSALWVLDDNGPMARQGLVALLVAAWSARLAAHIAARTVRGHDDPRYAALAQEWGADAPRRMFLFAQSQAVAAIPLVLSVFIAAHRPQPGLGLQDLFGAAILVIAIAGEGIADAQLRRFSSDARNRGKVCDQGLWRWSRHPNYFFQWLGWLAYPLIAFDSGGTYAWFWLTLTAPALMYWLLVKVSGIPPLEAHMLRSRGALFAEYQRRTSAFFPRPPAAHI
jgi:steroid 5-alpha reductase family enzyme